MRFSRLAPVGLSAIAALLALLAPSTTTAAYSPVGSGRVQLTLTKSFSRLLAENGVRITVTEGAVRRGRAIVMPTAGGEIDPKLGLGTVEAQGSIVFVTGRRKLPLRDLTFKTKRAPLYAKVGGGQLKVATAARLSGRRSGFGSAFRAAGLKLSPKAASRLEKKLELRGALRPGESIGSLEAVAQPATAHLMEQGGVQLALDPSFKQKLDNLFVSVNPIAPAEIAPGPVLSFPIGLESTLAPDASSGTLKLGGSVELLQLGNAQIFWREVWLQPEAAEILAEPDVEPSPPHPGKGSQGPILTLAPGARVDTDPAARSIDVTGGVSTLTAATAASFNESFAESKAVFSAGETIGVVSFSAVAE